MIPRVKLCKRSHYTVDVIDNECTFLFKSFFWDIPFILTLGRLVLFSFVRWHLSVRAGALVQYIDTFLLVKNNPQISPNLLVSVRIYLGLGQPMITILYSCYHSPSISSAPNVINFNWSVAHCLTRLNATASYISMLSFFWQSSSDFGSYNCRRILRTSYKCRPASLRTKITCEGTNNWTFELSAAKNNIIART